MRNRLLNRIVRPLNAGRLTDLVPKASTRMLTLVFVLSIFSMISRAAANITLAGSFTADDHVQLFSVFLAAPATVDIRSYGYAGGTTSDGTVVPAGGFDTMLTLFSAPGVFINDNDDGAEAAVDPSTGMAADARLMANLAAGNYIVAPAQYDNFSIGDLADGFVQTGNPNFTAGPSFTSGGPCPGDMFRDISGTAGRCRTGNWTIDFVNVASVTPAAPVPEPSALLLAGVGLALLVVARASNRRAAKVLVAVVVAGLTGGLMQAQTTGPDYSKVPDFLNGNRKLLEITDLTVFGVGRSSRTDPVPNFFSYQINTSNSQQVVPPTNEIFLEETRDFLPMPVVVSGRMFNQPAPATVYFWGSGMRILAKGAAFVPLPGDFASPTRVTAMADFNLDGFDDFVFSDNNGIFRVATAIDVNATDKPSLKLGPSASLDALIGEIAVGDFNGDGKREIAGLVGLPNGGLKLVVYTVDPSSLTINAAGSLTLTTPGAISSFPMGAVSIARGRFNSATHDQLAVTFGSFVVPAKVEIIDFDSNTLQPREASAAVIPANVAGSGFVQVRTGQFGFPDNPWDQIAFGSAVSATGGTFVAILSVNPIDLTIKTNALMSYAGGCGYGISISNFDHQQDDPLSPGQRQHNPNAQIALLSGACDAGAKTLSIYSVDPHTFSLTTESVNSLPGLQFDTVSPARLTFIPMDLHGRSLTLGEPTKITISSKRQPSVVIGVPPMHVDFVSPDPARGMPPMVMNLSAVPDGFSTTYQQDSSTGTGSNTSNKTSWSFGAKETESASITIGDPDKSIGERVKDTFTAAQNLKGASEKAHGTYQAKTFNLSATTGFGDEVSYTDNQFNIWTYPVIGQTTCPAGKQCPPDAQVPLTIQFSAPSGDALVHAAQGQALQWYQPPWEPGNIFSYPANLQQLNTIYPNLNQLTNGGVEIITDTSTITQKTTWAVTQKDSGTTSFDQNYSFENDFSITGQVEFAGLVKLSASADIDVTGSVGFTSLTENTTNLGLSTGVQVTKPGTFPNFQNYGYSVAPYIMGTAKPGGVVDSQPLSGDVQTFGLIRAMFTADPLAGANGGFGAWWKQAYNQPDVALNHPSRWDIVAGVPSNPLPSNCLSGAKIDCAVLSRRSPDNPWLSTFHNMRGFFISNAAHPGQGPQLEQATAGDVLTLQTRVYNYSFAPMPAGSKVHVRFYFMPWNQTAPAGDSVLIGEDVLDPIAPFSDEPGAPLNWVLARTTFDTKAFAQTANGASVVFWVVVWVQGADGTLMPEMPGHGLTSIPGTLKSLSDVAEECQIGGNCFSNNLGLYHQIFYIAPALVSAVPGPLPATTGVDIDKVSLSSTHVALTDHVVISAVLTANDGHASGTSVNFYEGDPRKDGRLFEVQNIPHISRDLPHQIQTVYRATSCGVHQLFVAVNRGEPTEVVRRVHPVRAGCPWQRGGRER